MLWSSFGTVVLALTVSRSVAVPVIPQTCFSNEAVSRQLVTPDADEFIRQIVSEWSMPGGLGLSVVHQDPDSGEWIDEFRGYGMATQDGAAVTEDTLFAIGSNSKLFTTVATGLLVSNGSLSWTSKIASIFPEWGELPDEVVAKYSTIVDLMSHRTGFPRHDLSYSLNDGLSSTFTRLKALKMSAEFRWTFQYNNMMYTILSFLPTAVLPSKLTFRDFIQTNILDPLGMSSTTYSYQVAQDKGTLADGFAKSDFDPFQDPFGVNGTIRIYPFWNQLDIAENVVDGPGGVISSPRDMGTWMKMLLLDGSHPETDQTVVPPQVLQEVTQGITVASPMALWPEFGPQVYGGGQFRGSYRGHEFIRHDGLVPGFVSSVFRIPRLNLGIAVLTNNDFSGGIVQEIITYLLADRALGLEPIDWNSRYKAIITGRSATGASQYGGASNATESPLSLRSLAGMYHDDGYGDIELCVVPHDSEIASDTSAGCQELLQEMNTTLPGVWESTSDVPTLIGKKDSVLASHIQLSHYEEARFNATLLLSVLIENATRDSSEQYWVSRTASPSAIAEFVEENGKVQGCAVRGIWGAGAGISSPSGETVKERAEVWFDKF